MSLANPVQVLANIYAHALYFEEAFPNVKYVDRNWEVWHTLSTEQRKQYQNVSPEDMDYCGPSIWVNKIRRPRQDEISVIAFFPQMWGSTALGFNGIGGAAITTAYTVVLKYNGRYAVYFNDRFAYAIDNPNALFVEDLNTHCMACVREQSKYSSD